MSSTQSQPGVSWPHQPLALALGLSQRWWMLLLRGIVALAFGLATLAWPGLGLITLTVLWGFYALADAALALGLAVFAVHGPIGRRLWIGLIGVVSALAGLAALGAPAMVAAILVLCIGVWAVIAGGLQIWGAIRLRKEIANEWLMIASGALSLLFGAVLLARPLAGALAVAWLIGFYAVLSGGAQIGLSFRLRKLPKPG